MNNTEYNMPITVLRFSWVHDEDDILAHSRKMDGVAMLCHPDGRPGMRHIVGIKDVVQSILLALGNKAAIGHAFTICGPAPFTYDVLAKYVFDLPIVKFEYDKFYDFQHSLARSRSILGYNPVYDIFRIVDDAIEFRGQEKREHLQNILTEKGMVLQ